MEPGLEPLRRQAALARDSGGPAAVDGTLGAVAVLVTLPGCRLCPVPPSPKVPAGPSLEVGPLVSGTRVTLRGVAGRAFRGLVRAGDWSRAVELDGDRVDVSFTLPRGKRRQSDIPAVDVVDGAGSVVASSPAALWFGVSSIRYAAEVVGGPSGAGVARLTEANGSDAGGDPPFPGAFRIDYDLPSGDRSFRFLTQSASPNRHPVPIGAYAVCAWVHGDGSGLRLSTRVTDADERVTAHEGPAITWHGWRWVRIPIGVGDELRELDGAQGPLVFTSPGTPVKGTLYMSAIGTVCPPNPDGVPHIRLR